MSSGLRIEVRYGPKETKPSAHRLRGAQVALRDFANAMGLYGGIGLGPGSTASAESIKVTPEREGDDYVVVFTLGEQPEEG